MLSGPDIEIDYSQFTYGLKQSQTSESKTQTSDFDTCESDCSVETHESLPEPTVNEPKVVSQPKVWSDAPIIEEYESDSEDEHVSLPTEELETPSFANKQVKTLRETIKNQFTHSKNPKKKDDKKGLGYGFTTKAFNIARSSGTNNVSTARHNFNSQAVLTNAARKISTVKPFVNRVIPKTVFHKTHSPLRRPFNNTTALRTNFSKQKVNTAEVNGGKRETTVKPSADYPHRTLQNKGIVDSGCSRHMTGNKAYLAEYQDFNGGPVAFGGSKGYITGKGKIKTGKLDFEDVCFVKELQHFNLFSVSQMCDKKNKVLFTDSECLVLSPEFKLPDENQVLLRIPRQNNMYSFNLENIVPSGGLACLIAKATIDESNKWHRRLGHVNFKNLNKLVKGNLVRGLPSKIFQNDHTCVACQKGKQHKASCKAKSVSSISQPLQLLHMDLFGPTSVRSLNYKTYCLVITDDFSRCDNGTKFKNKDVIEFCGSKGINREYSNARTPQQNGVAERKNMTLIEAARTMPADSFLPNTFWAEAVSTACYVLNKVLVTKPQNKTPYELVTGKGPTWLFDLDYLTDSMNYQPVRSENQANKHAGPQEANQNAGTEENIDAGDSPIEAESAQDYFVLPIWSSYTSTVKSSKAGEEPTKHPDFQQVDKEDQVFLDELERLKRQEQDANDAAEALRKEFAQETEDLLLQAGAAKASSTNIVNTASTPVSTASPYGGLSFTDLTNTDQDDSEIPALEEIYDNPTDGIFTNSSYDDEGAVADFTNLEPVVNLKTVSNRTIGDQQFWSLALKKVDNSDSKDWCSCDLTYKKKAIEQNGFTEIRKDERDPLIGLMYLTASRPVIRFRRSVLVLGKSTKGGCQFLARGLISWQCKKAKIVAATSYYQAVYVAAANCMWASFMDSKSNTLEGDIDGTEELLLLDLFNFLLTKVSTDSAKLIPLGKDSTALKTLEKIPPRV
ncbi:putative ribonuclease H-like domain-containing protein [Tanacetum coccineum]